MDDLTVVAIPGSTRDGSLNRKLLSACAELAPEGVTVDIASIAGIPLFDADGETELLRSPALVALVRRIDAADAVLFATPEYNQSVPGVLKNAIDWLSRPRPGRVLAGRPAAVTGATTGPWGTRHAQRELRHVLGACGMPVLPDMLFVAHGERALGEDGLTQRDLGERISAFLAALSGWARRVR